MQVLLSAILLLFVYKQLQRVLGEEMFGLWALTMAVFSGGKLSGVNRITGMNTVGLLSQIGIMNPFSRKQESEADYLGMIFSSLSGYDIRETKKLWERMKKSNKGKEPAEFMSTHPSSTNRIKNLNEWENEVTLEYPPIKII